MQMSPGGTAPDNDLALSIFDRAKYSITSANEDTDESPLRGDEAGGGARCSYIENRSSHPRQRLVLFPSYVHLAESLQPIDIPESHDSGLTRMLAYVKVRPS